MRIEGLNAVIVLDNDILTLTVRRRHVIVAFYYRTAYCRIYVSAVYAVCDNRTDRVALGIGSCNYPFLLVEREVKGNIGDYRFGIVSFLFLRFGGIASQRFMYAELTASSASSLLPRI